MLDISKIKRKRKTINNIIEITKAMETVSAVRMKKAQEIAISARPYAKSCLEIMATLAANFSEESILFKKELKEERPCLLVVASDKGLCGSFNSNIFKKAQEFLNQENKKFKLITIGKRAFSFFQRRNFEIITSFQNFSDVISPEEISPILEKIFELYQEEKFNILFAIYNNFLSAFKQEVVARKILPIEKESVEEIVKGIPSAEKDKKTEESIAINFEYLIEPDPFSVFEKLIPFLFKIQLFHIILESNASEHTARMIAMKNAKENAQNFLEDLVKSYNKARQETITKEITEIITSKEALLV
jgi:F-type H+-transporting ATPase subunit gamma